MKKVLLLFLIVFCTTNIHSQIFSGQKKAQVQAELASHIQEIKGYLPQPISNTLVLYDLSVDRKKNIVVYKYRFREDQYGSLSQLFNKKEKLRSFITEGIKNDDLNAQLYWNIVYLGMSLDMRIYGNTSGKF